ncbi:unnamed protein product [Caenorhabditis angaria]|uniref:THAP-type domain-containing protein n=1 Tax=Caenorhabditis angaria TaxID=860376 RepID=A0A9P1ILS8_9PELO|nr:unnamed protein product [Caenorhabditis angaria]
MDVFRQSMDEVIEPKFSRPRITCAYCEKTTYDRDEMTMVPQYTSNDLEKWVDILGGTFWKNIRGITQRWICKSHFRETWKNKRPRHCLPFANLGRPEIDTEHKKLKTDCSKYKCAFCEKIDKVCKMTVVPTNERYFNKWVHILGEDFRKNVVNSERSTSMICRSHFDVKFQVRPPSLLPKSVGIQENPVKIEEEEKYEPNMLQCCYCLKIRESLDNMRLIPKTIPQLMIKWVDILGAQFYENISRRKKSYICWEHFTSRRSRVFNEEIMEDFRKRQILKEHAANAEQLCSEQNIIPNLKEEEIEVEIEMKPHNILIEKDYKMEVEMMVENLEDEVKPAKEIKQECLDSS